MKDSDHDENTTLNLQPFSANDFKFDPPPPHFRASDYVKYAHISKAQFNAYFKFSFVRNPWARIVSEYKYRHHTWKYSFKEFLFRHLPQPSWTDEYCHIIPQYDFLYDERGKRLVDFVGKFEKLQKDFNEVCRLLNIPNRELPHRNQSQSLFHLRYNAGLVELLKRIRGKLSWRQKQNTFVHYTQYYDNETKEYVAELYKNDIEAFQYEFDQ
ncbi:MAG: hypothetical protein GQ559_08320 [Desulfobulbaceae bacterium]|nr:hypothetical protein [Desulfobulbaceae bacterium]